MISKGKRQYLISLYVIPFLRYSKPITGKHRGPHSLVKEVATKGYYDGVKKLNHDDDIDVFHTIVKLSPTAQFLTIHRNKERAIDDLKQKAP